MPSLPLRLPVIKKEQCDSRQPVSLHHIDHKDTRSAYRFFVFFANCYIITTLSYHLLPWPCSWMMLAGDDMSNSNQHAHCFQLQDTTLSRAHR